MFVRSRASSDPTAVTGAVDLSISCHLSGDTIDFLLCPKRDRLQLKAFSSLRCGRRPSASRKSSMMIIRRIPAIEQLVPRGALSQRCRCRRAPYLHNIPEQDHRFGKKRIAASQLWFSEILQHHFRWRLPMSGFPIQGSRVRFRPTVAPGEICSMDVF